ncbi:MAG: NAD-dependent epimerase/dehydratase family protein, partial [Pseudomonadota bacterium]
EHDRPRSPYGQSKYDAEQALLAAHRAGDIRVTILRPVNVYGSGMKGNLMTLIRLARRGRLPPLPDLPERFSLVSVDDLCQAVWLAASGAGPDTDTPVYPVTDGHVYGLREVETAIRQALGRPQPRWALPRSALFLGALGLEIADRFLRLDNAPGLRNYHALTRGRVVDDRATREALAYEPVGRFQDVLPDLISSGEHQKNDLK